MLWAVFRERRHRAYCAAGEHVLERALRGACETEGEDGGGELARVGLLLL